MNLLMAVGFAVWQARHGLAWLTWLQQAPAQPFDSSSLGTQGFGFQGLGFLWSSALSGSGWNWMVLLPAAATLALLGGVVVYLALEEQ
jgi:apolipoprotein N-acyltransferase